MYIYTMCIYIYYVHIIYIYYVYIMLCTYIMYIYIYIMYTHIYILCTYIVCTYIYIVYIYIYMYIYIYILFTYIYIHVMYICIYIMYIYVMYTFIYTYIVYIYICVCIVYVYIYMCVMINKPHVIRALHCYGYGGIRKVKDGPHKRALVEDHPHPQQMLSRWCSPYSGVKLIVREGMVYLYIYLDKYQSVTSFHVEYWTSILSWLTLMKTYEDLLWLIPVCNIPIRNPTSP